MGREIIAAAFAGLLLAAHAAAQSATGDVRGVVVEQAGGRLAGVAIVAVDDAAGIARRTRSDAAGRFVVAGLEPGTYQIRARLDGFAETRQDGVRVRAGEAVRSDLELRRAPAPETLTLSPPVAANEPLRPDATARLEGAEIDLLPLPSRRPLDLLALSPLVTPDADQSGVTGLTVLGLPDVLLALQVDGVRLGADTERRIPYRFAPAMVGELRVTAGGASTSPPTAAGGWFDLVTRSGSRRFEGQLVERYRDGALAAPGRVDERLGERHPSLHAHQFGATLGGPLSGRATFFAAYDGLRERDEHRTLVEPPVSPTPAGLTGFERLASFTQPQPRARHQDVALLRTDIRLGAGQRVGLRYHHLDLRGDDLGAGGTRTAHAGQRANDVRERTLVAILGTAHGPLTNDLRVLAGDDRERRPGGRPLPAFVVRDLGRPMLRNDADAGPFATRRDRLHVVDTLSWNAGAGHLLKMGAHAVVDDGRYRANAHRDGTWVFARLDDFGTGTPLAPGGRFTQAFGSGDGSGPATTYERRTVGAFLQDVWRISDALTLDAGVRYMRHDDRADGAADRIAAAAAAGIGVGATLPDTSTWSPHVGLAWAPAPNYVARAAFGISHARAPLSTAAAVRTFGTGGVELVTWAADDGDVLPPFPDGLSSPPAAARPLVSGVAPRVEDADVRHATAGLEWEWMPRSSLVLSYLYASGRHLPRLVERNVGPLLTLTVPVAGAGGTVEVSRLGPGPAAALRRVVVLESSAASTFHGVQIEMRRALYQGVRYRLAYAWSRARDTGPTPVFAPESPRDRFVASGVPGTPPPAPADDDQPHRFLADLVFFTDSFAAARSGPVRMLLDRWRIAAVYSLQSGRPFSAYVAADLDGDGNAFNDIAPGTTRNGFRGAKEGRLDARLAREFRLGGVLITPSVDLFNAFNAFHGREVDDVLYGLAGGVLVPNPSFGERYTPRDSRTLQLGVSIGF